MFKTIKAKIIFIVLFLLFSLTVIGGLFGYFDYNNSKRLKLDVYYVMVSYFAENLNHSLGTLQENALDLALMGEIFLQHQSGKDLLDSIVVGNFENISLSASGGIWFEPFINGGKYLCSCAVKNHEKVIIDKSFETTSYDYPNKSWYKEISEKLKNKSKIAWSSPYYEKNGQNGLLITVGAGIYDKNKKLVGLSTVDWRLDSMVEKMRNIRPTPNTFSLLAKDDIVLICTDRNFNFKANTLLKDIPWYKKGIISGDEFYYNGKKYISFVKSLDSDMTLIVNIPLGEMLEPVTDRLTFMMIVIALASIFITLVIRYFLQKNINQPIQYLVRTVEKIGQGDLDIVVKMSNPKEFSLLAKSVNKMSTNIKDHIEHLNEITIQRNQIESELNIARDIQLSALPQNTYSDVKTFDIYGLTEPARIVGGDFYDYFFVDSDHFVFLTADVSGKGIPAALFMMRAKTTIKTMAKMIKDTKLIMKAVNNELCKNNEQTLFVTAFMCILELSTGKLTCINAGHNPPILQKDGKIDYLKCKSNFVLAGIENVDFEPFEVKLSKGDGIILYTDGVTEAFNPKEEMYGEERLLNRVKSIPNGIDFKSIAESIKCDVKRFTDMGEQSDDMTILVLKFNGNSKNFSVKSGAIMELNNWFEDFSIREKFSEHDKNRINVVLEEIFVNISNYSGAKAMIDIDFELNNRIFDVTFKDDGAKYNPLEHEDPDVKSDIEEREIGGLGIFLIKKMTDFIDYEYREGKNILKIRFELKDEL